MIILRQDILWKVFWCDKIVIPMYIFCNLISDSKIKYIDKEGINLIIILPNQKASIMTSMEFCFPYFSIFRAHETSSHLSGGKGRCQKWLLFSLQLIRIPARLRVRPPSMPMATFRSIGTRDFVLHHLTRERETGRRLRCFGGSASVRPGRSTHGFWLHTGCFRSHSPITSP